MRAIVSAACTLIAPLPTNPAEPISTLGMAHLLHNRNLERTDAWIHLLMPTATHHQQGRT